MDISSVITASAWVLPVIFAVTLHEAAHGWMAARFGDKTATILGRVTANPIKHIDKFGTIILPGLLLLAHSPALFGYAKPVPVNFMNLKPQRFGMFAVAFAGPGMNIIMALISAIILSFGKEINPYNMPWWQMNFFNALVINCALAVFNMVPLLPLDGGRVLRAVLPGEIGEKYAKTERYGMLIVFGLLFLPSMLGINFFMNGLVMVDEFLINGLLQIVYSFH